MVDVQFSYTVEIVGQLAVDSFQLPPVHVCHPCVSDEKKKKKDLAKSYSGHSALWSVGFAAPVSLMCIMSRVGVIRQFTLLFHFLVSGPAPRRVITGKYIVKGRQLWCNTCPHIASREKHFQAFTNFQGMNDFTSAPDVSNESDRLSAGTNIISAIDFKNKMFESTTTFLKSI